MRWSILFRTLCSYNIFRRLIHLKPYHIQNSRHSRYCKSIKYSLHRILQNLDLFTTLIYQALGYWEPEEYHGPFSIEPCVTLAFYKTQGIFRTLPNIYYEEFYSEPCVTLPYLKPWHIQGRRFIHNTAKYLSWNILFKTLCNPDILRTLCTPGIFTALADSYLKPYSYSKVYS